MGFLEILFRLLAAFAAGGLVGLERQIHGRPAGLRTHILVSTGRVSPFCSGHCPGETAGMSWTPAG